MRKALCLIFALLLLGGCTTVTVGNYIRSDHPYTKKIYGDYDKIVETIRQVLAKNGYKVILESYPSVYERPVDAHQETPKDVLLFTEIRQHSMVLYSSYTHLNVYIRSVVEGAEVEVRFGKVTSFFIKQFQSTRDDQLGKNILDQIERAMLVN